MSICPAYCLKNFGARLCTRRVIDFLQLQDFDDRSSDRFFRHKIVDLCIVDNKPPESMDATIETTAPFAPPERHNIIRQLCDEFKGVMDNIERYQEEEVVFITVTHKFHERFSLGKLLFSVSKDSVFSEQTRLEIRRTPVTSYGLFFDKLYGTVNVSITVIFFRNPS